MESFINPVLMFITLSMARGQMNDAEIDDGDGQVDSVDPFDNCTNITTCFIIDDEYIDRMYELIYPFEVYQWLLIAMHIVVFTIGLVGNALVCIAVYRNHTMQTVTNYFIVNLAIADLLVIIVCLPSTVVWDITETWFLGLLPCKIVLYLQTVSVTVSVLTLTFISIDRWYAICFPLRFKSTTSRAKTAIIIIWILALLFDIPDLITLHTYPPQNLEHLESKTILFQQCGPAWSNRSQMIFTILKFILLYTGPLLFMSFAYCQIVRVLWRSDIPGHNLSTRIINSNELNSQPSVGNPEGQLKSRRKAAKMLVAVVLMFAVCCFPVHLFSILRGAIEIEPTPFAKAASCLVHWLYYANSAINPLIYNFMSGKFRKEFKRTFCCPRGGSSNNRADYRMAGMSKNKKLIGDRNCGRSLLLRQGTCNNTTYLNSTRSVIHTTINNNNVQHSTEIIPDIAIGPSSVNQSSNHYTK